MYAHIYMLNRGCYAFSNGNLHNQKFIYMQKATIFITNKVDIEPTEYSNIIFYYLKRTWIPRDKKFLDVSITGQYQQFNKNTDVKMLHFLKNSGKHKIILLIEVFCFYCSSIKKKRESLFSWSHVNQSLTILSKHVKVTFCVQDS